MTFSAGSPYPALHKRTRLTFLQSLRHRPLLMTFLSASVVLPAALVVYALEEVPMTGRLRMNIIPYDLDIAIGHHAYHEFIEMNADGIIPRENETCRAISDLGDAIVAASGMPQLQNLHWDYTFVYTPEANAMVLMGGNVIVYSGMVELAGDLDSMAVVLSHEIAHVLARHTAEQLTNNSSLIVMNLLLRSFLGFGVPDFASQLFVMLPNSRKNESEADFIGLLLLARLGLDPRAAPALWRRMAEHAAAEGEEPLSYLSTHPSHGARIQQLEEWMPNAMEEYKRCHGTYPAGYEPLIDGGSATKDL